MNRHIYPQTQNQYLLLFFIFSRPAFIHWKCEWRWSNKNSSIRFQAMRGKTGSYVVPAERPRRSLTQQSASPDAWSKGSSFEAYCLSRTTSPRKARCSVTISLCSVKNYIAYMKSGLCIGRKPLSVNWVYRVLGSALASDKISELVSLIGFRFGIHTRSSQALHLSPLKLPSLQASFPIWDP